MFVLPVGADSDGPCLIEPAVICNHCGYCKSSDIDVRYRFVDSPDCRSTDRTRPTSDRETIVFVTRRIPSAVLAKLEAACEVDIYRRATFLTTSSCARVVGKQGLLSVVTDSIDRAVFEAGRDLKVVSTIAVGYNNIDVAAARERNVTVTNTPDVLTEQPPPI